MALFLTLLAVLGLAFHAHATPDVATPAAKSSYCANFDDLPQNPEGFNPYLDPVRTYRGISYLGFVVATQKNADSKYFAIPSQPNVINSADASQGLYGGSPALQINTTATGGSTDTFTLTSLRLACLVTNGNLTSNANGCTILFVGNKRSGADSVVYEYEYPNQDFNPGPSTPVTPFGSVTFPNNFKGLTEVFISQTSVQNGVIGVNTLLDDVCLSIQG